MGNNIEYAANDAGKKGQKFMARRHNHLAWTEGDVVKA